MSVPTPEPVLAAVAAVAAVAPVTSPCINVCQMDAETGWCAGCLRSLDEIGVWSRLDEAGKRAVCAALPQRRLEWQRLGRPSLPQRGQRR